MTRRVVGLDLSLTSTGVAVIVQTSRGYKLLTDVIKSKGKRSASLVERHARLTELGQDILRFASVADLVAIEGPVTGGKVSGSPVDRYSLFWWVAGGLIRRHVPVAVIPPTSLKLGLAGTGKADKVQVALAVARLWPDADLGNNDSADAAGLAHLAAVHLGWDVPTLERHKHVKAEWPDFPDSDTEEVA